MLTLVTSNRSKYKPFLADLDRLRIQLEAPKQELPELQSLSFEKALEAKAQAMAGAFQRPVLVDDAGVVLEAYDPFPGPLTSVVIRTLGKHGLARLLTGVSDRARMECHLGCWVGGKLRSWRGVAQGRIDPSRQTRDERMILSDLFVPDEPGTDTVLVHRARALAALEAEAFTLHLEIDPRKIHDGEISSCPVMQCPFCVELEGESTSIFREMIGERLTSRILFEDEDFVIFPPLGEFIEGGLLLLTRQHIPSFAWLRPEKYSKLEKLLQVVCEVLRSHWGVSPLVFEHGTASEKSKGACCVDHAHLNIFPAPVQVHPHLCKRMHVSIHSMSQLEQLRPAEFGYLFVQENDGTRHAYDGQYAPSQLVRRIITSQLGFPQRWHWRDWPGLKELVSTYSALQGQIRL